MLVICPILRRRRVQRGGKVPGKSQSWLCSVGSVDIGEISVARQSAMPLQLPTTDKKCPNDQPLGAHSPVPACFTTRKAPGHQMLFSTAAPLVSFFFFSSFAIAGIYAPDCSTTWKWVCMLSFPHHTPWPLPDLMAFSSSRSILSGKVRVRSQRI
jgi:hypothetical protein